MTLELQFNLWDALFVTQIMLRVVEIVALALLAWALVAVLRMEGP